MADVKWIKIVTDIFDDEKIRYIETLPNGDETIVIWFRILCLAGKSNRNGVLMMTDRIAYTDEMLSSIFARDIKAIQMALSTFNGLGMIEMIDNKIYLTNWEKHQNVDKLEQIRESTRKRVAMHRERKMLEMNVDTCTYCGEKATGLDHIIATARGGTNDESNLVPCCIRCNKKKNDKPLVDFLNNNREIVKDSLVVNNSKLSKYVFLSNVTNRYNVTPCNATDKELDIDKDKRSNKKITRTPITFGQYGNVKLTQEEYEKLGDRRDEYVSFLDAYMEEKGYKAKNHYLTIKRWVIQAVDERKGKKQERVYELPKEVPDDRELSDADKQRIIQKMKNLGKE